MATLTCGNTALPEPVELSTSDEIIWSANTERSSSGDMIGEAIAEKKTLDIKWGVLTESEVKKIKNNLVKGFFPITFRDMGTTHTITVYRGTLTKNIWGISEMVFIIIKVRVFRSCRNRRDGNEVKRDYENPRRISETVKQSLHSKIRICNF